MSVVLRHRVHWSLSQRSGSGSDQTDLWCRVQICQFRHICSCFIIRAAADTQDLCVSGAAGFTDAALTRRETTFFAGSLYSSVICQLFTRTMRGFNLSLDIESVAVNRSRMAPFWPLRTAIHKQTTKIRSNSDSFTRCDAVKAAHTIRIEQIKQQTGRQVPSW